MNFEQMMAELRAEYIASIPQKMIDIESHRLANDFEVLRDDFHKLKGTGKTYGIPEVSDVGLLVEQTLLQKKSGAMRSVELGLQLLQHIYDARKNQRPYDLLSSPEFTELKDLAAIP